MTTDAVAIGQKAWRCLYCRQPLAVLGDHDRITPNWDWIAENSITICRNGVKILCRCGEVRFYEFRG